MSAHTTPPVVQYAGTPALPGIRAQWCSPRAHAEALLRWYALQQTSEASARMIARHLRLELRALGDASRGALREAVFFRLAQAPMPHAPRDGFFFVPDQEIIALVARIVLRQAFDDADACAERALGRQRAVADRVSRGSRLDEYLLSGPMVSPRAAVRDLRLVRVSSNKPVRLGAFTFQTAPFGMRAERSVRRLASEYAHGTDLRVWLDYTESGYRWLSMPRPALPLMPHRVEDLFADLEVLGP